MNDSQLDFLDILNILSFIIGVMNYNENLTQGDKQDLMEKFDNQTKTLLNELHAHLEKQDGVLENIIERLEVLENDENSEIG